LLSPLVASLGVEYSSNIFYPQKMTSVRQPLYVIKEFAPNLGNLADFAESACLSLQTFSTRQDFLDSCSLNSCGCLIIEVGPFGEEELKFQAKLISVGIHVPVIFLSIYKDINVVVRAMKAGAIDFFQFPCSENQLITSIYSAISFNEFLILEQQEIREKQFRLQRLSTREHEVMMSLVHGLSGNEIALELGISYRTMEKYRFNLNKKLDLTGIVELVFFALKTELICPNKILAKNFKLYDGRGELNS